MKWVPVTEAAKTFGCTRENIHQLIERHGIPSRLVWRKKTYKVTKRVQVKEVDIQKLSQVVEGKAAEGKENGGAS